MIRTLPLLLVLLLVGACGPKKGNGVDDASAWMDKRERIQVRLDIVEVLLEQRNPAPAMQILAQLQEEKVNDPLLDLYQGKALHIQGMHAEAEALYMKAADRMGRDPRPSRAMGLLYADTGRIPEAIQAFEAALEREDDAATWNNLGFMLHSQLRHKEAVPALQRAVSLDGTVDRYRNNLGYALAALGRYDEALRSFMSLGDPADAHTNLGTAFELTGDSTTAAEHYALALQFNPAHAMAQEAMNRLDAAPSEVP